MINLSPGWNYGYSMKFFTQTACIGISIRLYCGQCSNIKPAACSWVSSQGLFVELL